MATTKKARLDPSRPHEELEALRTNLEIDAEQAAWALITLNRQIQPKLDEQARKAARVVGAVLGLFRAAKLTDQQAETLDRLYGVLEARDLTAQERVRRAVELTDEYGRAYVVANDEDTRERCADDYVIWLATTVDPKWIALRATAKEPSKLEASKSELASWRPLYEAKKRGTHNAFAILARLNEFVGVSGFGLKGAAHVERTQKAIEAAYNRPTTKIAAPKTRRKTRKKPTARGSRAR